MEVIWPQQETFPKTSETSQQQKLQILSPPKAVQVPYFTSSLSSSIAKFQEGLSNLACQWSATHMLETMNGSNGSLRDRPVVLAAK